MAELTTLESKLGEVVGLAMAAQEATQKVLKLTEEEQELAQRLQQMQEEAAEAERRGTQLIENFEGKKTAILEEARETKSKASEMLSTYIDQESDALDGFEFLTMAEAGELGHVEIMGRMNEKARNPALQELVEWALPIQQRHFDATRQGALTLAGQEDPNEPA